MSTQYHEKGGDYRIVLEEAVDGDSFVLPAGCIIEAITIKETDDVGGDLSIGVDATNEVSTLQITGTPDAPGNITIALDGNNNVIAVAPKTMTIPILTGVTTEGGYVAVSITGEDTFGVELDVTDNTPTEVATALAAATWPTGYSATSTDADLFVLKEAGDWAITDIDITESATGLTIGATEFTTSMEVTAGDDGTGGTITVNVAGTGDVTVTIGASDTPADVAAAIAAETYTGYTATALLAVVTFTKDVPATTPFSVVMTDVSTGATFDTQVVTASATLSGTATSPGALELAIDAEDVVYAQVQIADTAVNVAGYLAGLTVAGYTIDNPSGATITVVKTGSDIATFVVQEGTTGVTIDTIVASGTGTIADLLGDLAGESYTAGYTVASDGIDTLTFRKTVFGDVTDMTFTDTGTTGMLATAATTTQGGVGTGVVDVVALSGVTGTIAELTVLAAGKVQSMTQDSPVYINLDASATKINVYVSTQKLD
jgi:hypothetical protein